MKLIVTKYFIMAFNFAWNKLIFHGVLKHRCEDSLQIQCVKIQNE